MSRDVIVAKRYARALFELANEQHQVELVEEQLTQAVQVLTENQELNKLLVLPNVQVSVKQNIVKLVLSGQSDTVVNTILLLIEKGRESLLTHVLQAYVKIANEALGLAEATVYTPYPLSEADALRVTEQFSQLTGKAIRISNVIDRSLIGGMQVRIGDRVYDGSLSGKLQRLSKSLQQNQVL